MPGVLVIFLSIICLAMIAIWLAMMTAQPRLTRRRVEDSSDSDLPDGADRGNEDVSGDGGGDDGGGGGN